MKTDKLTIPAGLTCGDCALFAHCVAAIGIRSESRECDYYPVRFLIAPARFAELKQALAQAEARTRLPETARRRFCLTCRHEPDWHGNRGDCKIAIQEGEPALRKFTNPDEVILGDGGQRVINCTGWEPKENEAG